MINRSKRSKMKVTLLGYSTLSDIDSLFEWLYLLSDIDRAVSDIDSLFECVYPIIATNRPRKKIVIH